MSAATYYYVKTGLAGYGPDLDPEDCAYDGIATLCSVIGNELNDAADYLEESASALAESEDYETAWKSHALAMELDTLRANLDYDKRKDAPLYADDRAALDETMTRIIAESFPLDITPDGYTRLYVWEAECDGCDTDPFALTDTDSEGYLRYVATTDPASPRDGAPVHYAGCPLAPPDES